MSAALLSSSSSSPLAAPAASPAAGLQQALAQAARQDRRGLATMVAAILLLGLLLPWVANAYWVKTLISALSLSVAVAGVAVLYGQLGLVSLCQYALLGAGGWVALRVSHGLQWPFELCVLAGGLAASLIGMLAGLQMA